MNCYECAICLKSELPLQSGICQSMPNLGQDLQEEPFPPLATSLQLHISLRPDTGVAKGSGSQTRIRAEQNMVIALWTEINNTLWLLFHLSFMHLNLYSPKSYTYVLKCLQKSQISPLQLQVPYKACFLLKKKKSIQKKCILSQSLSHLALQKIIREMCFAKPKISPSQNPALFSSVFCESNTGKCNGESKEWPRGQQRLQMPAEGEGEARRIGKRNGEDL